MTARFDLTDVDARAARDGAHEIELRRIQALRVAAWRRGYEAGRADERDGVHAPVED